MGCSRSRVLGLCLVTGPVLVHATGEHATVALPIGFEKLVAIAFDGYKPHEAALWGVPSSYDWSKAPRMGAGNDSHGFSAATGWGQAFYAQGSGGGSGLLAIRNFQTLLCTVDADGARWVLRQSGALEGGQFRADYRGNHNEQLSTFRQSSGYSEVSFVPGSAFHFWPAMGRFELSQQRICGFLMLLEAKLIQGEPGGILIGLGADYWTTRTAPWDNYKTNKDVAIGRLKKLKSEWEWFGLTTASGDALRTLSERGYRRELASHK